MEKNNSLNSHCKLLGTGKSLSPSFSFCLFSHAVIWRKETPIILFSPLSSPRVAMVTNYPSRLAFLCTQSLCFAKRELKSPIYSIPPHLLCLLPPASFRTVPFKNSQGGLLNQGCEIFSSTRLTTMIFLSCLKTGLCNCKYIHIITYEYQSFGVQKKILCEFLFVTFCSPFQ